MLKKSILLSLVFGLVVFTLTACGGSNNSNGNNTKETASATAESHNVINIPDENFKAAVLKKIGKTTGDITKEDVAKITELDISSQDTSQNIYDLTGIEYFTTLTKLNCSNNSLSKLDLSHNNALEELVCSYNGLTILDVKHNTALTTLNCSGNDLSALDLSNNTALVELVCSDNKLTKLDLSHNAALTTLNCSRNDLSVLDLSNNTALEELVCSDNKLTKLDLSHNAALTSVFYQGNDFPNELAIILNGSTELYQITTEAEVSLKELLSEPQKYDGKLVRLTDTLYVTGRTVTQNWLSACLSTGLGGSDYDTHYSIDINHRGIYVQYGIDVGSRITVEGTVVVYRSGPSIEATGVYDN